MARTDWQHSYVVLRYDSPGRQVDANEISSYVTSKSVHHTSDCAEKEVIRLNKLNEHKGCFYFWQSAKIWPNT